MLEVKAKRHLVQSSASTSNTEIDQQTISTMPQREEISLPKLITTTTPGTVQGPFGQMFIRGNHANIQYQIDGVQLPDSPTNTFGQAFSPRNIDHMEIITGGIPAEYGERLAAVVVNIATKTGPEKPGGELELNYGSYNTTLAASSLYGGSNESRLRSLFPVGGLQLHANAAWTRLSPRSTLADNIDQAQGGTDAVHDRRARETTSSPKSTGWLRHTMIRFPLSSLTRRIAIRFPTILPISRLRPPVLSSQLHGCLWKRKRIHSSAMTFNWVPSATTNDSAVREPTPMREMVWKHTFNGSMRFMQLAPYYKYSQYAGLTTTRTNDSGERLSRAAVQPDRWAPPPSSFFNENKHMSTIWVLKGDYSSAAQ